MKLKFKQTVFLANLNYMPAVGDVKVIENKAQAQSLIDAGYAEKVVDETPSKKVVEPKVESTEEVKPVKKSRAKKEVGDK